MPILTPITDRDESTYRAIARAKRGRRRVRLENAWPILEQRYAEYANCVPKLETLADSRLSGIRKSDCKHCYDVDTRPKQDLVRRILNTLPVNGSPWCQYCLIGEVDSVTTMSPKICFRNSQFCHVIWLRHVRSAID